MTPGAKPYCGITMRNERIRTVLLEAPIVPTLLRLAAPNVLVMLAQAGVGLIETYFVGKLGTDALAGMALVFPVVMLMQMTSAGAMGGGIASAIARALGARRRDDADALVLHALVIAAVFALIFRAGRGGRRALALHPHGRHGRSAGSGPAVFQLGVFWCASGVAVQHAVGRDPRHGQHGGAGLRDRSGRLRSGAAIAAAHLWWWAAARAWTLPGAPWRCWRTTW